MTLAIPITVPTDSREIPTLDVYRLSVDQYHRMIQTGILTEEDGVELLRGLLVERMTQKPPHIVATDLLQAALGRSVPTGWFASMQNPVTTADSEPEPDARVVRGTPRDYLERRVGPGDVALVVEVADSSLAQDRGIKLSIYAGAGIPCYWIVNLVSRRLEAYSDPDTQTSAYRTSRDYGPDEHVALVIERIEVAQIAVADLLP